MSRRRYSHGSYRRIRTTQERRSSFACEAQYVRPARNFRNLPNAWDDKRVHGDTSWKGIRKKQYRANGRGKQHEIVIEKCKRWYTTYRLREYFDNHDIPYRIEDIKEQYTYTHYPTKAVEASRRPNYQLKYSWVTNKDGTRTLQAVQGRQIGWKIDYVLVPTGEVKILKASSTVGYKIVWWSDKDIGMEYILSRIQL
jgi:hypothetical protein